LFLICVLVWQSANSLHIFFYLEYIKLFEV